MVAGRRGASTSTVPPLCRRQVAPRLPPRRRGTARRAPGCQRTAWTGRTRCWHRREAPGCPVTARPPKAPRADAALRRKAPMSCSDFARRPSPASQARSPARLRAYRAPARASAPTAVPRRKPGRLEQNLACSRAPPQRPCRRHDPCRDNGAM
eukprot:scaffold57506_cov62-Phaeocystis_antarctica.AAC.4